MTEVETLARAVEARTASRADLAALTVAELRELASVLGIGRTSQLRKESLMDAISDTNVDQLDAPGTESEGPETAAPEAAAPETAASEAAAPEAPNDETPTADEPADAAPVEAEPAAEAPAEAEPEQAPAADEAPVSDPAPSEDQAPAEASGPANDSAEPLALPDDVEPVLESITEPVAESTIDTTAEPAAEVASPAQADADLNEDTGEAGVDHAPRAAASHQNSGITGIAEDLEELQRREQGDEATTTDAPRGRRRGRGRGGDNQQNGGQQNGGQQNGGQQANGQQGAQQPNAQQGAQQGGREAAAEKPAQEKAQNGGQQGGQQNAQNAQAAQNAQDDRAEGRGRGRYRDRKRRGTAGDIDEPEINDDDVLIPIAGILDVLDNYAFVRTSGYLPGASDVYVSLGQVKKYHLRRGDAVVGAIKQPPAGDASGRQKYNALVRIDNVNGLPVADAERRVEFEDLTPLYPQERLRLETDAQTLATRVIDLVAPIGKGQRGLIVAPPKSGKTVVLQAIANAITKNNPEAHLMVVLVDERPEEVTEMQRTVKGEVIASTFDRPAEDHTTVAELAIERAKRLVELGYDVVVLLDSITRLGRAFNQVTPPSGRILAGGLDAAALYPPKRFFGAARNVENGGSLTVLATALVETGSKLDEAIFEEFTGTGNLELRLSRELADKRVFPAIDLLASGTRREEMLMGPDEVDVTWALRRSLADLDVEKALTSVTDKLRETGSNVEYLIAVQKSQPVGGRTQ